MEFPVILGIGTTVPAFVLDQRETLERIVDALRDRPDAARWAKRIFARCGVETRYTCEPNLLETAERCRYIDTPHVPRLATTEDRMNVYQNESVRLAAEAARKALADSGIRPGAITHLIAASCTGLILPGLDAVLAWELDLSESVRRVSLTFLGCAAGMTAIRMAEEIVRSSPEAKVLIVTVELCTLHIQPSLEKEDLFSASFFGDGASACVIGWADPAVAGGFALLEAREARIPGTADKMRWSVGNYGFNLYLSPDIPDIIKQHVPAGFRSFWGDKPEPEIWAIHPGGKGILEAVQTSFGLTEEQMHASRSVLRRYGNMSSATILFVMDELRHAANAASAGSRTGAGVAFGPGMTAELVRFAYYP